MSKFISSIILVSLIIIVSFSSKAIADMKSFSNKKGTTVMQKDNINEAKTPYKDEREEIQQYMYAISLCLQGGSVGQMIALCDDMAKNYPEYSYWCQIQKALVYNKYSYVFGKDIELVYNEMFEIFKKTSPYFENQEGFDTNKLIIAQAYNELKQYQKAIDLLNDIEHIVKKNVSLNYSYYLERSKAKALLGDYKNALDDLNKIDVKEETYLLNQEEYIVVKQVLEKLVAGDTSVIYPEPSHNRDSIMGMYLMSTFSNTSKFDFDYPEKVMPKSSVGLEIKGIEYSYQKNYKQAEEYFAKALERAPNELSTYFSRAQMYKERKMYKEALKDLDMYLKTPSAKGYKLRAEIKYEMKDYNEALKDFELHHSLYAPFIEFSKESLYAEYPNLKKSK